MNSRHFIVVAEVTLESLLFTKSKIARLGS
jgi:hypothetical protein